MKTHLHLLIVLFFSLLTACSANLDEQKKQQELLSNATWQLQLMPNSVLIIEDKPISLTFDFEQSQFFGFGGCNNFSGHFSIESETILFGPIRSTRMHCRNTSKQESSLFNILNNDKSFSVNETELNIYASNGKLLATFTK